MKLAIKGKVIDCSRILDKSIAQFAAQLRQNGVELEQERLESVYNAMRARAQKEVENQQNTEE